MAGTVKAITPKEAQKVEKELKKKYPHMYKEDWVKRLSKKVKRETKRRQKLAKGNVRTRSVMKGLKEAGIGEKKRTTLVD